MDLFKRFLLALTILGSSESLWTSLDLNDILDNPETSEKNGEENSELQENPTLGRFAPDSAWTDIQCHVRCLFLNDSDFDASKLADCNICQCYKKELLDMEESDPDIFVSVDLMIENVNETEVITDSVLTSTTENSIQRLSPMIISDARSQFAAAKPIYAIDGNPSTFFKSREVEQPYLELILQSEVRMDFVLVFKPTMYLNVGSVSQILRLDRVFSETSQECSQTPWINQRSSLRIICRSNAKIIQLVLVDLDSNPSPKNVLYVSEVQVMGYAID